jgi:hypothetical protein
VSAEQKGDLFMKLAFLCVIFLLPISAWAAGHGPVFGYATPVNSKGEWSFDYGIFGRNSASGTQIAGRGLIGYGITPHLTFNFTAPAVFANTKLPPTRMQPGDDFEAGLAWRFHHNAKGVGTRLESTLFGNIVVPGPQQGSGALNNLKRAPGANLAAVTGVASRGHYLWLGGGFTKWAAASGDRRPDQLTYSLVYGYRPPSWRTEPDKWDWRFFAELTGEHSSRFLQNHLTVPSSQAHQVFLGPSMLGIYRQYAVEAGLQFPIFRDVGPLFPRERVRFAVNVSYFLFHHSH